MGGIAADVLERVAGRVEAAFVEERWLDAELGAILVAAGPFRAHLEQAARELVTDDHRVGGDVVGHAFVVAALLGRLERGHAQRIGHHLGEDLVVPDGGQFKGFETQVFLIVHAQGSGLHGR